MFKLVRISVLLVVLLFVAVGVKLNGLRATDWKEPIWIAVYPINGDGSSETDQYIETLASDTFREIDEFLYHEINQYLTVEFEPTQTHLAPRIDRLPPPPPSDGNVLKIMFWSLHLRYWSWRTDTFKEGSPEVRVYMVYHDPATAPRLRHSLGLKEGRIGVVYAFASKAMAARNNIVLAHEVLHTLGATDKYDLSSNYPLFPHGFAEPQRQPRLPQRWAEIMAGRVPLTDREIRMPSSLEYAVVGEQTAREIRWLK